MIKDDPPPFYGKEVLRARERLLIENLLAKYRQEPATEELHKKIWDELQYYKHSGQITIPFKTAFRRDPSGCNPDYIEVILDTKV